MSGMGALSHFQGIMGNATAMIISPFQWPRYRSPHAARECSREKIGKSNWGNVVMKGDYRKLGVQARWETLGRENCLQSSSTRSGMGWFNSHFTDGGKSHNDKGESRTRLYNHHANDVDEDYPGLFFLPKRGAALSLAFFRCLSCYLNFNTAYRCVRNEFE